MIYLSKSFKIPATSYIEALIVAQKIMAYSRVNRYYFVWNKLVEVTENGGQKIKKITEFVL